ncbi:MAG: hypothetical protein LBU07_07085 [Coriobacteriales bacterium]|jgi:hypothetical protein|nr:hypothetical protein [Coriobacteriales bacterium]
MYVRIQEKAGKGGTIHRYASIVRSDRIKDKVVQTTVAYLGSVEENQIPYLKAAYAKDKPRLVYSDGAEYPKRP